VQIGDFRTPEGVYFIEGRMPQSKFYRALRISYPDQLDRLRAQSVGLTAGGDILIHGLPNGRESVGAAHRRTDWTEGCIAVTNQELDEIWAAVPDGAPINIKP
jgi:murein L,D-transpeptidase YafK